MFLKSVTRSHFFMRSMEMSLCSLRNVMRFARCGNGSLKFDRSFCSFTMDNVAGRFVPLSAEEFKSLRATIPLQPEDPHLLKVSILGEPNVGKSTLTNRLVKWKVCAVSRKVHTTRKKASAILVEDNRQIVFLDTPGFVSPEKTKRHSLEPSFVMDPIKSIREADLIAVVVDISDKWTNNRIHSDILRILYDFQDKKSILVMNKIDAMKSKNRILDLTRILTESVNEKKPEQMADALITGKFPFQNPEQTERKVDADFYENVDNKRGWPLFSEVFMVSALKNDGIDDLRDYLLSEAKPGDWMYNQQIVTDQHPHEIAVTAVREKLLEYLPNEIPYTLDIKIVRWDILSTGSPKIDIKIVCPNSRHRSFVIGPGGKHIAACVEKARKAMRESFRKDVVLHIAVI